MSMYSCNTEVERNNRGQYVTCKINLSYRGDNQNGTFREFTDKFASAKLCEDYCEKILPEKNKIIVTAPSFNSDLVSNLKKICKRSLAVKTPDGIFKRCKILESNGSINYIQSSDITYSGCRSYCNQTEAEVLSKKHKRMLIDLRRIQKRMGTGPVTVDPLQVNPQDIFQQAVE